MNIYHELIYLTAEGTPARNPEGARQAIGIAANQNSPLEFRRQMRDKTAHFILPEIPEGCEFSRDCFWSKFRAKFIWRKVWTGSDLEKETAAKWLQSQRETAQVRRQPWPPKPTFRKVAGPLPQPWDGKEERPGRVPRTGK